jgi:peptide-methionine (S)-S-oxide reductase
VLTDDGPCRGRRADVRPGARLVDELLDVFWQTHDPTRRAGSDQYRSVVFFHDDEQRRAAVASQARTQAHLDAAITTEIAPAPTFYDAEDRHQQYLEKHGRAGCTPALAGMS